MRRVIAIAGIATLGLGWAAIPADAGTNASFISTPSSGPAGTVIHASDPNFHCDSTSADVHVEVFDQQQNSIAEADTTVSQDATWQVDVTIPDGTEPGEYIVTAFCTDGEFRVPYGNNSFTVTPPPPTTTTSTTVAAVAVTTTTTVPVVVVPAAEPAAPVVAAPALAG